MELLVEILIWLHFMGLAAGGAAAFGIPVVDGKLLTVSVETRPVLLSIIKGLAQLGRIGFGTLIVTGLLLVWLKYGADGLSIWFWVKMALVAALLVGVIYAGINFKRAQSEDPSAGLRSPVLQMINIVLLFAVVAAAALAF